MFKLGLNFKQSVLMDNNNIATEYSAKMVRRSEAEMTTLEVIEHHGFEGEKHIVTTEDGYILELHRIRPLCQEKASLGAVVVGHGVLCSSFEAVHNGPKQSLGFLLSQAGFDVWLANYRGNHYSGGHTNLSNTSPEYWDFSFHEKGVYDLPAIIDHILVVTQCQSVTYIGISMGTTILAVMLSQKPAYSVKVKLFVGLATVISTQNVSNIFGRFFAALLGNGKNIPAIFGLTKAFPLSDSQSWPRWLLSETIGPYTAGTLFNMFNGCQMSQPDSDRYGIFITHTPAQSSMKTFTHFCQCIKAKRLQLFDYAPSGNITRYNTPEPPSYNFAKWSVKTILVTGDCDTYNTPADVECAIKLLGAHNVERIRIDDPHWSHLDFLYGKNCADIYITKIIDKIKQQCTDS